MIDRIVRYTARLMVAFILVVIFLWVILSIAASAAR